jgi:hypothetical protein
MKSGWRSSPKSFVSLILPCTGHLSMLSRVASITRKVTRRYTTNGSGGSTGGSEAGAKSKTASSSGSPAKLGMTWLEKKAELDRGSFGTKLACAVVLAVSAATIYEQQSTFKLSKRSFVDLGLQASDHSSPTW